jgi:hypothetical protein
MLAPAGTGTGERFRVLSFLITAGGLARMRPGQAESAVPACRAGNARAISKLANMTI